MFDIGAGELLCIAVVMLLIIPPKHLPAMIKVISRRLMQVKKSAHRFKAEIKAELQDLEPPHE